MLPLPPHYDPTTTNDWGHTPDHRAIFQQAIEWQLEHRIRPAATDEYRTYLVLIDVQRDFCFPEGTLYVGGRSGTGALDDNRRITEFIYRNISVLTSITTLLDTHDVFDISGPAFWVDRNGAHPPEQTAVPFEHILNETFVPNPTLAPSLCDGNVDWLKAYAKHYARQRAKHGAESLWLWPPHCILGSDGHVIAGAIHKARIFHSFVRDAPDRTVAKADSPLTENMSGLCPTVATAHDGKVVGQKNSSLMAELCRADRVVVGGQIASHRVCSLMDDLVREFLAIDPSGVSKLHLLKDCVSSVTVADGGSGYVIDETEAVAKSFERFTEAGVKLISSIDPL